SSAKVGGGRRRRPRDAIQRPAARPDDQPRVGVLLRSRHGIRERGGAPRQACPRRHRGGRLMSRGLSAISQSSVTTWFGLFAPADEETVFVGRETAAIAAQRILTAAKGRRVRIYSDHDTLVRDLDVAAT